MKKIIYSLLIAVTLASCNSNEDASDAFGNFETEDVIVSSESNGKLLSFTISEGLQLKAGDIVGYTDTNTFHLQKEMIYAKMSATQTRLISIDAEINVQKQMLANFTIEQNRIKDLFDNKAATQQQLDQISGQVDLTLEQMKATATKKNSVSSEINVLKSQIDQINENIKHCFITNPLDGVVLGRYAMEGEITAMGKALYKIANIESMTLKVYVTGSQLPHIKIGQTVTVMIDDTDDNNQSFEGEIFWISDEAEFTPKIIQTKEERVNLIYAVKIKVKNDGSLKKGMPGEVKF